MDNITHTLAGCLLAEGAAQAIEARTGMAVATPTRRALYVVSAAANNLPDADIVYVRITEGPLGYLLHHRGHTHTFVGALALGALLAWAATAWLERRKHTLARAERAAMWLVGVVGACVHIGMDGGNIYGVHPFWPVDNAWYFGDAVFIVEPLLWVTAAPVLFVSARSRWAKGFFGLTTIAALLLPWLAPDMVPLAVRLALVAIVALVAIAAVRMTERARPLLGVAAWLVLVAALFGVRDVARAELRVALRGLDPQARALDLAVTSMPGNPLCWTALAVQRAGDELVVRRAVVSVWPSVLRASDCPSRHREGTAPLERVEATPSKHVVFDREFRAPARELADLAKRCDVHALMRFVRVPFWTERDGKTIVGDLRFDRSPGPDFAELDVDTSAAPSTCPDWVAPWTPPRLDVIGAAP